MMYIKNTIQDFVIKFKTNDLNMGEIDFTAEENKSSLPVNLNGEIRFFIVI